MTSRYTPYVTSPCPTERHDKLTSTRGVAYGAIPPRDYRAAIGMVNDRRWRPDGSRCRRAPQDDVLPDSDRRRRALAARFLVRFGLVMGPAIVSLTFALFRLLVLLEWMISYGLGRPCSIQDEE